MWELLYSQTVVVNPKPDHKIACFSVFCTVHCRVSVWAFLNWSAEVFDIRFLNEAQ